MRYVALACDYDGTLATDGRVDDRTLDAVRRLRESGRHVLLVTGRELDDLQQVFPHLDLFDRVVAENGVLLFDPAGRKARLLAPAPPATFLRELARRGVPFSVGRSIVATWKPHDVTVLRVIRDLGLELEVIFNKDAVMVLPAGANKATGLAAALQDLHLSPHNVVAVGDAENDHALLRLAECGGAVANALPTLKEHADLVTDGDHGAGVTQLIDRVVADDLRSLEPRLRRHEVRIGQAEDGRDVTLLPYGPTILVAGPSSAGKSTLTTVFLEQLVEKSYQFCLIDPEGDYEEFAHAVTLGGPESKPEDRAILHLLEQPSQNAVVNLTGVARDDRPKLFERLLPKLLELRARTGRPHWMVLDEAHHLLPASWHPASVTIPREFNSAFFVTLEPAMLATAALAGVDTVVTVGNTAGATIDAFERSVSENGAGVSALQLPRGEAAMWSRAPRRLLLFHVGQPEIEHRRHRRKYAEGKLEPDEQFRFRGPHDKLNLRAQNLVQFVELAEGVDADTWLHHLKQGDYSRWFRDVIKDAVLAERAAAIEKQSHPNADRTREQVKAAIAERYTI